MSGSSIDFTVKNGFNGVVALTGEKLVDQAFHRFRDACERNGRGNVLGSGLALGIGFYIADNENDAMERLRPFHDERFKWFAPFGFVRYADEEGRVWGTPGACGIINGPASRRRKSAGSWPANLATSEARKVDQSTA